MKHDLIVAYFADRTLGWSYANGQAMLQGDREWVDAARLASDKRQYLSLYDGAVEGRACLDNPNDLTAVFLALAAFPRERIRIDTCPEGMTEKLNIDVQDADLDPVDGLDDPDQDVEVEPVDPIRFSREKFLTGALKIV